MDGVPGLPESVSEGSDPSVSPSATRQAGLMADMPHQLVHPPKARPGERIAVLSPSFAAAGAFPAVHEQAMRRLCELTGLIPIEYPTTREVGATPQARAADINAAFADPAIRGMLAVIGGEDQIRGVSSSATGSCAKRRVCCGSSLRRGGVS